MAAVSRPASSWRRPRVVPAAVCAQCGVLFDVVTSVGAWACRTHLAALIVPTDRDELPYFPCCGLRPSARGVRRATGMLYEASADEARGCCRADHAAEPWDAARLQAAREHGVLTRKYKNSPPREPRAIKRTIGHYEDLLDVVDDRTGDLEHGRTYETEALAMNEGMWLEALADADFYMAPHALRHPLLNEGDVQKTLVARISIILAALSNPAALSPVIARLAAQHASAPGNINPLRAFITYAMNVGPINGDEATLSTFYTHYVSVLDWLARTFPDADLPAGRRGFVRQLARDVYQKHVATSDVLHLSVIPCWQVMQVDELKASAVAVVHHAERLALFARMGVDSMDWL